MSDVKYKIEMKFVEVRILRWMCGVTRMDFIKNTFIRRSLRVINIVGTKKESRLRRFRYIGRTFIIVRWSKR